MAFKFILLSNVFFPSFYIQLQYKYLKYKFIMRFNIYLILFQNNHNYRNNDNTLCSITYLDLE